MKEENQNHFTIVIDGCNHGLFVERCLLSCLTQKYKNFEVIAVDARSDDNTFEIMQQYAQTFKNLKVYQNEVRLPQIANFLWLTQLSNPGTICVSVDSDDWLKHSKVLQRLNEVYNSGDIWMTYGTYEENPYRSVSHIYHAYPQGVIDSNTFREHQWLASHLRTWRRELFLLIKEDDFKLSNGNCCNTAGDQVSMLSMLEMSGNHSRYIKDVLYIYNVANQSRDGAINEKRQIELANYVRSLPKYQKLEKIY